MDKLSCQRNDSCFEHFCQKHPAVCDRLSKGWIRLYFWFPNRIRSKMDEVEYKLNTNNSVLIVNAIDKLISTIKSKFKPTERQRFVNENEELKFLREKCSSKDARVSLTACQGLLALVELGVLEIAHTMSTVVTLLPSAQLVLNTIYDIWICLSRKIRKYTLLAIRPDFARAYYGKYNMVYISLRCAAFFQRL